MRLAVLTDIHGNLQALTSTLKSLEQHHVDHVVCLGDTVGYGGNPAECIDLVQQHCDVVIAGNHDWGVSEKTSLIWFNSEAQEAALWTRSQLTPTKMLWLSNLPLEWREGENHYVHGSPESPQHWLYIRGEESALVALEASGAKRLFVGHSHRAEVYHLELGAVVSAGSVGQPRDGDNRAGWCLCDEERGELEIIRVEYNIAGAQAAIREAGLPDILAQRLEKGR